jgi:hypothetical protein
LGRIIGLIGCTCLVIVALRLTNLQYADKSLKGGEARVPAGKISPREHYKLGKELFLRGKYRDAVKHLDAAVAANSGLTGTERRTADDYLDRARSRLQTSVAGATVRAQSQSQWDEEPAAEPGAAAPSHLADATRNRVEKLMVQATAALKRGDRAEARSLAQLANQIAKDAQLTFSRNEPTPAGFLAKLQNPAAAAVNNAGAPHWAADDVAAGNATRRTIQQTSAEFAQDEPTVQQATPSSQPANVQDQAAVLVSEARNDFKAGRYEEARRKALAADQLDTTFGPFEDRPELILADVDRMTNTTTFADSKPKAQAQPAAAQGVAQNARPASATANAPAGDSKKQQAARLLELAKQDIANGNLDAAQTKAEQAAQLNVAYKLFEDMPEIILSEIAARRASEGIAQNSAPSKTPAAGTSPAAKPKALALLA